MGNALTADASHDATEHWWHQRLTAGANLVLLLWFMISLALLPGLDTATVSGWIAQPIAAIPLLLLVGSTAYHFRLGLHVVIEDYVSGAGRAALVVLVNFFAIAVAAWAVFSILKVAFTAGAI